MAAAMEGWSRKEKLYILQGVNNLDFDKLETKIPTRTREEIKNAVLYVVNGLADAPRVEKVPLSKLQHIVSITSKDPDQQRLKTQIVRQLPNFNYVPPPEGLLNIDVRELFQQIANAIEGKPVVADAATMDILQVIIEEVSELCDGYISPELDDFIARINSSAIPMPPSAAKKELQLQQQTSVPEGMHAPANTNIPPMYSPAKDNMPPMYSPANTNIQPMYSPPNTNIPSMYAPANTYIPTLYTPANTNIPAMYEPAKTNNPAMYESANTNIPAMYEPAIANIPAMYADNSQPATCEFGPIYAPVTCTYEPVFPPANYNFNPIHEPPKIIYSPPPYPPAMGNYNPVYAPPMYNIICTPGKANCRLPPCNIYDPISVNTQALFEPTVPAHPPGHELPSLPVGSGAYRARPNGQYGHAMNRNE